MSNELEQIKQKQKELDELIARLESKQEWIPADGQVVLVGNDDVARVSTGKLNRHGSILCYSEKNSSIAWETWKPAKHIPSVLNKIPHDGSKESPIADGVEHIAKYNIGGLADGKKASDRDWPRVEWYAILESE